MLARITLIKIYSNKKKIKKRIKNDNKHRKNIPEREKFFPFGRRTLNDIVTAKREGILYVKGRHKYVVNICT